MSNNLALANSFFSCGEQSPAQRLPKKPYCSDDLSAGLKIRSLDKALNYKYLQINPPHLKTHLIFDIDRKYGALAWEEHNLPSPNFVTITPKNSHAHLVYALKVPVLVDGSMGARDAPIRLLAAIQRVYMRLLGADAGYSGLITKNPLHQQWTARQFLEDGYGYDLKTLQDAVDIIDWKALAGKGIAANESAVGLGRNCDLFDTVRRLAYKEVRQFWGNRTAFVAWQAWCYRACQQQNLALFGSNALEDREANQIARSIAGWTWAHTTPAGFRESQRRRGRGGVAANAVKSAQSTTRAEEARLLESLELTRAEIADRMGLSVRHIIRLLDR